MRHLAKIVEKEKDKRKIFIITRTNEFENVDIRLLEEVLLEYISKIYWLSKDVFEKKVKFITAHSVKWLEADVVILLDPVRFPLIHKNDFIELLFDRTVDDLFEEERRLFYVAVTRTLNKLYYFYDWYEKDDGSSYLNILINSSKEVSGLVDWIYKNWWDEILRYKFWKSKNYFNWWVMNGIEKSEYNDGDDEEIPF